MNTQHTPGPWHVGMKPGPMVYGPSGEQVANMHVAMLDQQEHIANARLIAAAPELLEALQTTQDAIQAVLSLPAHEPASVVLLIRQLMEAKGKANEAIAKATQP